MGWEDVNLTEQQPIITHTSPKNRCISLSRKWQSYPKNVQSMIIAAIFAATFTAAGLAVLFYGFIVEEKQTSAAYKASLAIELSGGIAAFIGFSALFILRNAIKRNSYTSILST